MAYVFRTIQGDPAVFKMRVRLTADPFTLTAHFTRHPYDTLDIEAPFLSVPVTSEGKDLTLSLTTDQVNAIRDAYFYVEAESDTASRVIETGEIDYSELPPVAMVNENGQLILIDAFGREFMAGSVVGPQGPQGIQGLKGDTGNTGPVGPPDPAVAADLAAASELTGPDTLVRRDSFGGAGFGYVTAYEVILSDTVPDGEDRAVRKDYVDAIGTTANTALSIVRRDASGWIQSTRTIINASPPTNANEAVRKDYADALGSSTATANSIMRRDANADTNVRYLSMSGTTPSAGHAVRKDYVDLNGSMVPVTSSTPSATTTLTTAHLPSVRNWTLGNNVVIATLPTPTDANRSGVITLIIKQAATGGPYTVAFPSGINWLTAIPVMSTTASASMRVELIWTGTEWLGVAAEADLAAATDAATANALVRRDVSSNVTINRVRISQQPVATNEATRKDYVDSSGDTTTSTTSTWGGSFAITQGVAATAVRTLVANTVITGLTAAPAATTSFTVTYVIVQATTGGPYTVTWPANLEWAGDVAPVMPTPANAELIVHLLWTGAAWRGLVGGVFLP